MKLITTKELAEYLQLKEDTLRNWRSQGEGPPYVKFGDNRRSAVRYDVDKVQAWIQTQERRVGEEPESCG